MKSKSFLIYLVFLLIASISFFVSMNLILPRFVWINESLHSTAEAFGSMAAIFMAIILLHRKHEEGGGRLFWMAIGLLSMGLLQGFHAAATIEHNSLVLSYSFACLSGGFWFALVWLPESDRYSNIWKWIPLIVAVCSVLFGVWTLIFYEKMPLVVEGGKFTLSVSLINLLAGIFFLSATVRFLLEFQRSGKTENLLFSCMALLFGLANLSFPFSAVWDDIWWFWHLLRVLAFLFALWFVLKSDQQMISKLKSTIIERKQAEEALRESEMEFRSLVEEAPMAITVVNKAGELEYINKKNVEIIGYTRNETPTLELWWSLAYSDPEERKKITALWGDIRHRVLSGENIGVTERKLTCKDGTTKDVELRFSRAGEKVLVIFNDVTERKRVVKELQRYSSDLEKSNKELQEALANVKTLSGMLPICASCKKIRDDKGYWSGVETYISEHTDTVFSHGICPECEKKAYKELEGLKKEGA